jgi:hypothetical protein
MFEKIKNIMNQRCKKNLFLWVLCFFFDVYASQNPTITPHEHREPSNAQEKNYYSCRDALLNASTFRDIALNMMWTYIYTMCSMEMGLQSYIQKVEKQVTKTERDKKLLARAKDNLMRVQKVVSPYLEAFRCSVKEFSEGGLRKKLDQMKLEHMRNMESNGQKRLMK